ncbi:hypothetical protein DXG01_001898 [Tephrocybe rancida]|nr:hypothetical protein DXG01_001898 [Tephrocybe rancida]
MKTSTALLSTLVSCLSLALSSTAAPVSHHALPARNAPGMTIDALSQLGVGHNKNIARRAVQPPTVEDIITKGSVVTKDPKKQKRTLEHYFQAGSMA